MKTQVEWEWMEGLDQPPGSSRFLDPQPLELYAMFRCWHAAVIVNSVSLLKMSFLFINKKYTDNTFLVNRAKKSPFFFFPLLRSFLH